LIIHHATLLASDALLLLITNDVPAVIVPTDNCPVLLDDWYVRNILLLDVTAVVDTVTVPDDSVAVPIDAFEPVAILTFDPNPILKLPDTSILSFATLANCHV
jgi:hypothetical protein